MDANETDTSLADLLKRLSELSPETVKQIVCERLTPPDCRDAAKWVTARLQKDPRLQPRPFEAGSDPELEATRASYDAETDSWMLFQKGNSAPYDIDGPFCLVEAQKRLDEIQGAGKNPAPVIAKTAEVIEIALLNRLARATDACAGSEAGASVWPTNGRSKGVKTYRDSLSPLIQAADAYLRWYPTIQRPKSP